MRRSTIQFVSAKANLRSKLSAQHGRSQHKLDALFAAKK
jgi:hypothetical protein